MFSYLKRGPGFYQEVVLLAVPIVLQYLVTNALSLVDTFMVGVLGESPMAAVTLANIPCYVLLMVIFGIQSGSAVLISQHWGKSDPDSINRIIGIGLYLAGGITLFFSLLLYFFPVPFLSLFSNNEALVLQAASYGKIVGFSYFFNSLTEVYLGAHRSMGNPRLGMIILALSMMVNTFLNWVLIFGHLGAPALGIAGAALATLLSRILEFVITVSYAATDRRFRLRPALLLRPGQAMLAKFIRYGTPVVANETLWGLGTTLYPTIMGHMTDNTQILAAFTLAGNLEKVCIVAIFGVAGTTAILVGKEIGAGRSDRVYELGLTMDTLALFSGILVGGVMLLLTHFVFAPYLFPMFGLSEKASSITLMMLTVIFTALPIHAFNTTNIVGVLRGGGDVRMASLIDLFPLWLVSLPVTALFGLMFQLDIFWVYLATMLEQVIKFFAGVHRLRSGLWIHDLTQFSYQKKEELS